jgi:hypothetical protein
LDEKLFVPNFCLDSKFDLMEKLLVLKNYTDSKINWMEKLLDLKIVGWKNY